MSTKEQPDFRASDFELRLWDQIHHGGNVTVLRSGPHCTHPSRVPSGRIVRIEPFGDDGAIYVEGERRAFAGYVFVLDDDDDDDTEARNLYAMSSKTIVDAAKRVRQALKRAFPQRKISVTSSGYIKVTWTDDGPSVEQVEELLVSAGCATVKHSWNDTSYLEADGHSFYFDRYNAAERAAAIKARELAQEEDRVRRERENKAVNEALVAKHAAVKTVRHQRDEPWIQDETALQAFDALRQRAENEAHISEDNERRPSWAPPLLLGEELAEICLELGYLTPDNKWIGRLWATFGSPKRSTKYLREHVSRHTLEGLQCRGFQFFAGSIRQSTGTLLFEAQSTGYSDSNRWRFGPAFWPRSYSSPHWSEWQDLLRKREYYRIQQEELPRQPDYFKAQIEELSQKIAAIDAEDLARAQTLNTQEELRRRAMSLARARILDFVGAPDAQMQLAARLCGRCCICFKELTDPISLERGIGPDCYKAKIDFIKALAQEKRRPEQIAFLSGMALGFVSEILSEAVT